MTDSKKPLHTTEPGSPPIPEDTHIPPQSPYGPSPRFIPNKVARIILIIFGIIFFMVTLSYLFADQ